MNYSELSKEELNSILKEEKIRKIRKSKIKFGYVQRQALQGAAGYL